jgi:DNA-binding GntR family transcriptional regulator
MSTTDPSGGVATGPPASKTEYALQRLRAEIASGIIRPGEAVRQGELAKRYGVSPTPVREALRVLEAEGSISYAPHRGATVSEMSEEDALDLYLLRGATEGLGARLAAERRTPAQLDEIRARHEHLCARSREPDRDPQQLAAWNRELHLLICAAGSQVITSQAMNQWKMFPIQTAIWGSDEFIARYLEEHDHIIEAIADGHPDAAQEHMVAHIRTASTAHAQLGRTSTATTEARPGV